MSDSFWPRELQHTRLPYPSLSPRVGSNSHPLSLWCYLTISSSLTPFSSCPWSFLASGSFPMSRFFTSGGQIIGASASASVLLMNIQGWFPLGLTGLGLSISQEFFKSLMQQGNKALVFLHLLFLLILHPSAFSKTPGREFRLSWRHFMGNRWGNSGNSVRLYFSGLQNHYRWWLQPWN